MEKRIQTDLLSAMKNKEEIKVIALRAVKAEILKIKTSPSFNGDLTDTDIVNAMRKMVKEREEVAETYENNSRPELAQKERDEANVIKAYLPKMLNAEEVESKVKGIIVELGAKDMTDFKKVMPCAMSRLKGIADGKLVSETVKRLLS